ncbi:armadillo repeat-containing protein 3 isoform X3 [Hydra vulgaris]|uniref:Armadillo repeat-containing protein 3 isoform X3 n=1 Tax=Hydra vulgaris TaxID=6087 RepID=A0ABM4D343_HYDVU
MVKKKNKEPVLPKDEFDPVNLVTKKPQTVVLMLQSPEENVLLVACETLYKFAEKSIENKMQLLSLGAIEHIVKLLNHESKIVKKNAAMCISSLASQVSIRLALQNFGCVESLLKLLFPGEEVTCHEFSTLSLSFFAEDYVSKAEIFEKNGFPLVIALLQSPDCDVQRNAVRIVELMLDDCRNKTLLNELNGVALLFNLLHSEYPVIQLLSLDALFKCSNDVECQNAIRKIDGVSKLVAILENQVMNDLHLSCLKCLAFILEDIESLKIIQSNGIFSKILMFITKAINIPEMQQYGASVIASASQIDEIRRLFVLQEVEKTLIPLLASENQLTAAASAKALLTLAENASCRDKIGKLGGVSLAIQFLKNESKESKEIGSLLLVNLTHSNINNCAIVMENNITDIFIQYLLTGSSILQSNIAICLSNLACNLNWRIDFEQHGVINGLCVALQSSDFNVQKNCCKALSFYLNDEEARKKLLVENAVSRVVELLQSSNHDVCQNASWVIIMCTLEKDLVEAILECGGLKLLQKMSLSSKTNPLTRTAFDKLMNSHLSMKYALTGILTFENIIKETFFDIGKVSPNANFESIQVLSNYPVDHRRPILLVNPESFTKKSEALKDLDNQDFSVKEITSIPTDNNLSGYIEETRISFLSINNTKEQIFQLARYVCQKMGGPVSKAEIGSFSFELHISELKQELQSNVIPIGMIQQGIYYHRALLFKVLADQLSLVCSLIRGDYGLAWNEVLLSDITENGTVELPPRFLIVDLMHDPGRLMERQSREAIVYQRI